MSTLPQAVEVIRTAEEQLRALLTRAVEAAEYDDLLVLTEWARILRGLQEKHGEAADPANRTAAMAFQGVMNDGPQPAWHNWPA